MLFNIVVIEKDQVADTQNGTSQCAYSMALVKNQQG